MEEFFKSLSDAEIVLFSALCFAFLWQLFFYVYFFCRIFFYKEKTVPDSCNQPVSVIICARNEEENLRENLPAIVEQQYPEFEVIVVNDCSEDETGEILKDFAARYSHFRFTTIKKDEKFSHGKKLAVMVGIKAAKYETLLFTDADCKPQSAGWLLKMTGTLEGNHEICLGYSGFHRKRGFLNMFLRYDAFFIAMHYLSFAMAGMTYMGVGRNLSYRKHLFFDNKGYAKHLDLDSGDDDLFINEVARPGNTTVSFRHAAQTKSSAPSTMARWMRQKKRHRSTFSRYKPIHRFWLSAEPLSRFVFFAAFAAAFFFTPYYYIPLAFFGLRLIMLLVVNYAWSRRLNEKDLFLFSMVSDIISIFTGLILVYRSIFGVKQSAWK
jgi:glycosyltransferase involved in cell wall biosynthesis